MIVIGASLGGMRALSEVLRELPCPFGLPIAAALHRHKDSDEALIDLLNVNSPLPITEALDKEPIVAGRVVIAPADYHLLIDLNCYSLSIDELVQYARPSIDVLFESAADAFGPEVIAVVLTGANQDGAMGAVRIKEKGGTIIVQDPATADSPVMPMAAIAATQPKHVGSLAEIGRLLKQLSLARKESLP